MMSSLHTYFRNSSSLTYSYLISLPLLFIYELLIYLLQPEPGEAIVRLTADIWIKSLFAYTGYNTLLITLLVVVLLGGYVFIRERNAGIPFRASHFVLMLFESLLFAIGLAFVISTLVDQMFEMVPAQVFAIVPVLQEADISRMQMFALSLGAGLYEELVFRVILVSALLYLFRLLFAERWLQYTGAVLTGAMIFSAVHYMGALGDPFTLSSFTFRFLFGVALNLVYIYRGFGIAAWTHSLYNVMVFLAHPQ